MATKTLILRPTSNSTSSNIRNYTLYPSDTATANIYLLLSEEKADDDATYISTSGTLALDGVYFTVPTEYTNITPIAIRLFVRTKTISSAKAASPSLRIDGVEGLSTNTLDYIVINYDAYETNSTEISEIDAVWNALVTGDFFLALGASNTNSSGGKSTSTFEVRYTQIYIEADYEEGPDFPIAYVKNDSEWVQAEAIYHKENGEWVECEENTLTNGSRYRVVYLNNNLTEI